MLIPARASACFDASTGPRPMISGDKPLTPVDTIRASGVMPSSRALVSLMMTTAAAPSFSGQQLPAVTVPSGRNTGFSWLTFSSVVPARGPSSLLTTVPSGSVTGVSGLSPEIMGLGPVDATKQALARAGMSIGDIDLVEINEAFAVQVIGSARELGIDEDRLNVHGGAIALGHPFGSTGARIMTTLVNGLQFEDKQFGLETMCVGGGQGMAVILERLS